MQKNNFDVIVIGSGPAAVNAAVPLVEKGFNVGIIDGGYIKELNENDFFLNSFEEIRKRKRNQFNLFLGKGLGGILSDSHAQFMISGSKAYISNGIEEFLPIRSEIPILQSLAMGGLGEAWGGVCDFFDEEELDAVGLPNKTMKSEYEEIIERIGISGISNDFNLQPPIRLDSHGRKLLKEYEKKKKIFHDLRITGYQPPLALLTKDKEERSATDYSDLDFWLNKGHSLYQSSYVIQQLEKNTNFKYVSPFVVTFVEEKGTICKINCNNILTKESHTFSAKKIIIAAGALNTVRILLRSKNLYNIPVRFITKSNTLVPSIDISSIGEKGDEKQVSLCQFIIASQNRYKGMQSMYAQLYSYKSLLLYKLLRFIPLPIPQAFSILSMLTPSLIIADIRIPSIITKECFCLLEKTTNFDVLNIHYKETKEMQSRRKKEVKLLYKAIWNLGLFPLRSRHNFTSAHYAGGAFFSRNKKKFQTLSTSIEGQVTGWNNIYVADSSTWNALPAKPPTLTIMANANRIGKIVARTLR